MKIDQSTVVMTASHEQTSEREVCYESTCTFRQVFAGVQGTEASNTGAEASETRALLVLEQLIQRMLELIFDSPRARTVDLREVVDEETEARDVTAPRRGQLRFDWTTRRVETLSESETTQFTAQGTVRTKDGRTLGFALDLDMCREFSCTSEEIHTNTVALRDPLVLSFDGKACELADKRFTFDLDADGQPDSIPFLAPDSGFLAIDRDQDGRIADGSELFGTRSGDGFADLRTYDLDGNGWIDEADPVYDRLRVWRHEADGTDQVKDLREADIGAVYLGSAASAFKLANADGQTLGQVRSSGIYLRENGGVGVIQHVDLSV